MHKRYELIVLDRDGVINLDSPDFVKNPQEWLPIPGSLESIARLNNAGFKVVVATNQSGLARELFTEADLGAIHKKMREELAKVGGYVDDIFICPHGPHDNCKCRKPKSGLLETIGLTYNIPSEKILSIGDSMRDALAADEFGCDFILVLTGNGRKAIENLSDLKEKNLVFSDLAAVVNAIL